MFVYNELRYDIMDEVKITDGPFKGTTGKFVGAEPDEKRGGNCYQAKIMIDKCNSVMTEFENLKKIDLDYVICLVSDLGIDRLIDQIVEVKSFCNEEEKDIYVSELTKKIVLQRRTNETSDVALELNSRRHVYYEAYPLSTLDVSITINGVAVHYEVAKKLVQKMF